MDFTVYGFGLVLVAMLILTYFTVSPRYRSPGSPDHPSK